MVRVEAMVKDILSGEIAQLRDQIGGGRDGTGVVGAGSSARLPTTNKLRSTVEARPEMNTVLEQLQQAKLRLESQKRLLEVDLNASRDFMRQSREVFAAN